MTPTNIIVRPIFNTPLHSLSPIFLLSGLVMGFAVGWIVYRLHKEGWKASTQPTKAALFFLPLMVYLVLVWLGLADGTMSAQTGQFCLHSISVVAYILAVIAITRKDKK